MPVKTLLITSMAVLLSSCATVTRGTIDTWVVETNPSGADVTLSNGMSCTTPCSLQMKSEDGLTADIYKQGYEPVTATIQPKQSVASSAGMAGNVYLGVLVPAGVALLVVELLALPEPDEFDGPDRASVGNYFSDDDLEMGVIKHIKTRSYD